jgi:ribosomal-protein-alanine N-acetyltransferase
MSARPSVLPLAPWRVRVLRASDVPAVMSIEREIYPFPWTAGNFTDSLAAGYDAWVLEADTGLIGYAIVMWIPDEVHLLNLSVAAGWQGQGVGRRLLGWLCDEAARRGAHAMFLEVAPPMTGRAVCMRPAASRPWGCASATTPRTTTPARMRW